MDALMEVMSTIQPMAVLPKNGIMQERSIT